MSWRLGSCWGVEEWGFWLNCSTWPQHHACNGFNIFWGNKSGRAEICQPQHMMVAIVHWCMCIIVQNMLLVMSSVKNCWFSLCIKEESQFLLYFLLHSNDLTPFLIICHKQQKKVNHGDSLGQHGKGWDGRFTSWYNDYFSEVKKYFCTFFLMLDWNLCLVQKMLLNENTSWTNDSLDFCFTKLKTNQIGKNAESWLVVECVWHTS